MEYIIDAMKFDRAYFQDRPVLLLTLVLFIVLAGAVSLQIVIGVPVSWVGAITGVVFLLALVGSLVWLDYYLESRHRRSEQFPRYRYSQGNYTLGGAFFFSSCLMMLAGVLLNAPPVPWAALAIYGPIAGVLMAIGGYWLAIAQRMYAEARRNPSRA